MKLFPLLLPLPIPANWLGFPCIGKFCCNQFWTSIGKNGTRICQCCGLPCWLIQAQIFKAQKDNPTPWKFVVVTQYFPLLSTEYHTLFWVALKVYSTGKWNWILLLSSCETLLTIPICFQKRALRIKHKRRERMGKKLKIAPKQMKVKTYLGWASVIHRHTIHDISILVNHVAFNNINRFSLMTIKWYLFWICLTIDSLRDDLQKVLQKVSRKPPCRQSFLI